MTAFGALCAGLLVLWALAAWLRGEADTRAARRLASRTGEAELRRAARRLPKGPRGAFEKAADAVEADEGADGAFAEALLALTDLRRTGWDRAKELAAWLVALAPALPALGAVAELPDIWARLETSPVASALLSGPSAFDTALDSLANGLLEVGVGLGLLGVVYAVGVWRSAPEVREARWAHALLKHAEDVSRRHPMTLTAQFAPSMSPTPAPGQSVGAGLAWLGAVLATIAALGTAAPSRAARHAPPSIAVWPQKLAAVEVPAQLELPKARGGSPLTRAAPMLVIEPHAVRLAAAPLFSIEDDRLPTNWRAVITSEVKALGFSPRRLLVVADGRVPVGRVASIAEHLVAQTQVEEVHLLFRRKQVDALVSLRLMLEPPKDAQSLSLARADRSSVRGWVRSTGVPPVLAVDTNEDTNWTSVIRRLGEADDSCPTEEACRLPGLGSAVVLRASPSR